ncbi:MAG: FAA hydrolase family protein [Aquabacterium sp.]|nr:MAG: FAA hydrolase family protein [Aquabacterium sp.]
MSLPYVQPPAAVPAALVRGGAARFAVRRIYCVGRNYAAHAREMGATGREPPFFFMKPADALVPQPSADAVVDVPYASLTTDLHYEVELVAAIGRGGRDIPLAQALEHVWGWGVGLDMTRRDLQHAMKGGGKPWDIAKGFDASAPIGLLLPKEQAGDIAGAKIELALNGQVKQSSTIAEMIWSVAEVIAELSRAWELAPGDLIYTGTPEGVGAVKVGDEIVASVSGLDTLRARIVAR